ncbi:Bac_surface_Ag domain-containing protein/Surf_Ag_VNR domain-containing protein [Cephalotus follicularis]|uniref:Bac_surface_Ag domain-containing protein/Surf_Ag_VNR domain-containing protein n=1 Tax=Cephalotus follicularis TaxID=3775 RepID=A0A1Q3D6B9_CEPFO|nr:Bac_surface_Ag domain-containing protein/Surf_Ag_VNR domain-containing protein [Cephalotus follicularis]
MSTPTDGEQPDLVSPNPQPEPNPKSPLNGNGDDEEPDFEYEEQEEEDEYEDVEEEHDPTPPKSEPRRTQARMENLARRMQHEAVSLRVHDVIIKGNTKTKDYLIEAELEPIKAASTVQELLNAARVVNFRLQALETFDSVNITLDAGPRELPGTANVIINVVETVSPLSGQIGAFTRAEARSSTMEASLKYKNLFGHGDLWDGSLVYGCDYSAEVSAGVHLPRFKGLVTPVSARVYLLSQDWLKYSSYKERALGLSLGLVTTKYHDVAYNLAWRTLTDPSQMSSSSIRRQLGHGLLSSLKYTFKIDRRNSSLRPTRGYVFASGTQIGGLAPDSRSLRFLRQELDLRYAFPLGFYRAALNVGISGGVIFPWGAGFLKRPSPLPERFFLGGNISPLCSLGGPTALWGFKTRGLGPTEPRRQIVDVNADSSDRDYLGGDLAVTAFADLSFDFPLKWLREKGIHGHVFGCAGNVAKLTQNEYQNFSPRKFLESFRSSVGVGLVVPTALFRMELNYCYILNKLDHDRGKSGVSFTFSAS